uniref:Uncharacterized protein n=2 Tax=viral metagenome TaxID=1070528 RepID=A0A6M3LEA6_9ZZZZ
MIQENRYLKGETFSEQWLFLGVSFHHWRTNIDLKLEDIKDPKDLIKGLVWDVDHGTTRQWGGSYYGKIPRIVDAYFEEE